MDSTFRNAGMEDLDEILKIVGFAKDFLRLQGVDQWQRGEPCQSMFEEDIKNLQSWVICQNGAVLGTCALVFAPEKDYENLSGSWTSQKPYAAMHRVAMHPNARGSGLASKLMQGVKQQCQLLGCGYIRVDTHAQNLPMQKFLQKEGFTYCGQISLSSGADKGCLRIAYDNLFV